MLNQDVLPQDDKLSQLLRLVARGEQEEAALLLVDDPSLLLEQGSVIDYSGREFNHISAFQYAAWAMDSYMCRMLVDCLVREQGKTAAYTALRKQYEDLERKGVDYKLNGIVHQNKHHFDFSPLQAALQNYLDHYESWDWAERESYWCHQVGTEQLYVPAHVAQEYCNKNRSPNFNSPRFERTLTFYNYVKAKADTWWCDDASAEFKLGRDFAIAGGQIGGWGGGGVKRGDWRGNGIGGSAAIDLAMITRLQQVRMADLKKMYEEFIPQQERPKTIEIKPKAPPKGLMRRFKDWLIHLLS